MSADLAEFHRGETVYHKVDEDPGLVTGIIFREAVYYEVTWLGRQADTHQGIELSRDRVYITPLSKKDDEKHETCG